MKLAKDFKKLCSPAMLYFVISIIAILFALFHGIRLIAVLGKVVFVLFWTFILNMLCSNGYKSISWFLVLLPYVIIILGVTLLNVREGFDNVAWSCDKTALNCENNKSKTLSDEGISDDCKKCYQVSPGKKTCAPPTHIYKCVTKSSPISTVTSIPVSAAPTATSPPNSGYTGSSPGGRV